MFGRKAVVALALVLGSACKDNLFGARLEPVPPVHRVPADVEGVVVLVADDPTIETNDPAHVARANDARIPQDYRASMVNALQLAGFRVASGKDQPHDLVAKLALKVDETDGKVRQVYRCGLRTADGAEVLQVDWAWPEGTYVDVYDVLDFATHHVATEVATSRRLVAHLRASRTRSPADGGGGGVSP